MRQRRQKRIIYNFALDDLKMISKILYICIIILLLVFIHSSIKSKNKLLKQNQSFAENNQSFESNETNSSEIAAKTEEENSEEKEKNEISTNNETKSDNSSSENKPTIPKDKTINMAFTGDIMCHNTIYNDAYNESTSSFDFSYIFDNIKYYLQTPDIIIGNLETTFAGADKKYSGYPKFNSPESLAYQLKKLGFDVLTTANNHCYDYGYSGIESTIKYLDDADISHTGTYTSDEAQKTILIKNVKGIKIAILNFTYGINGISVPNDKSYSVNFLDEGTILKQLTLAKEQNPDLICACVHWGTEYQTKPNNTQKNLADLLVKNGADIIIGNHPHVLQPMEKRTVTLQNGSSKTCFIAYSLGNFLADQNKNYTKTSAILNLSIKKDASDNISINNVTYTPIYIYKDSELSSKKFKLINLKNTVGSYEAGYTDGITEKMYNTFSVELNNAKKLLGDEIK